MATRIIFNGQEYASTDAMPKEVRKAYQQALAQFADADHNGIPDILERGRPGNVIGIQHSSITVNGRTYESVDANRSALPASAAAILGLNTSRALDKTGHPIERVIQVLLGIVAVVILAGAVFLMFRSRIQERIYVAIAALLVLGAVDSQVRQLVNRRIPFSLETTAKERRYSWVSLVLMLSAAVVLIGLALLLP